MLKKYLNTLLNKKNCQYKNFFKISELKTKKKWKKFNAFDVTSVKKDPRHQNKTIKKTNN